MTSVASREVGNLPPGGVLKPIKRGAKQREIETKQKLELFRAEQPHLTSAETAEFRSTYFQTLCTNILSDGYHRSFTELFLLISKQREDREAAGPDSNLWQQIPLEDEHEKLRTLARFLTVAEKSLRKDDFLPGYEAYLSLAQYFEAEPHDKWLSDYFYDVCLKVAAKITSDDGRKQADSYFNKGVSLERGGALEASAEHFKTFYDLTKDHPNWFNNKGKPLHSVACENLARVKVLISQKLVEAGEHEKVIAILQEALVIANESYYKKLQANCSYHLGLAYDRIGKLQVALPYMKSFYDLAKEIDDSEDLGLACEVLAKAYEKQGNMENSIKFLTEFASATEGKQDKLFSRACRGLGAVFNNKGDYAKAAEYFNKAFSVARSLNDKDDIYLTRTQYGISSASSFMAKYDDQIHTCTVGAIKNLHEWKDTRKGDNVKKDLPEKPICSLASRRPVGRTPPTIITVTDLEEEAPTESSPVDNEKPSSAGGHDNTLKKPDSAVSKSSKAPSEASTKEGSS